MLQLNNMPNCNLYEFTFQMTMAFCFISPCFAGMALFIFFFIDIEVEKSEKKLTFTQEFGWVSKQQTNKEFGWLDKGFSLDG